MPVPPYLLYTKGGTMMLKNIGRILLVLCIIVVAYLIYLGLFTRITFREKSIGPYYLVCEKHVGSYTKSGEVMDRIYTSLLNNENIAAERGFGLYYDNPQKVEEDKLRSIVGCILERDYHDRIENLQKNYRIEEFPRSLCLTTTFPYRGMPSIIMGVLKVYPALSKELEKRNTDPVPVMEMYDASKNRIDYIVGFKIDHSYYDSLINK